MPRFYERYNKGLAPYPIPAWLWFGLMLFCVAAALPTYGISLVLLIAIAWDRQSRKDTTPHPAAKINEDLIQEDLRKGRERKGSTRAMWSRKSKGACTTVTGIH